MRPRALAIAFVIYILGCASGTPGTQPSNDAAAGTMGSAGTGAGGRGGMGGGGGVAGAAAGTGGSVSTDAATTGDAPADVPVTGDAPAEQPSNDGGSDAPAPTDASGDRPADTSAADRSPMDSMPGEPTPPAPGKVYAHSADTLYLLEPISKQVTMVGTFTNCPGSMVDIAIDKSGKMTGAVAISFNGALGGAMVTVNAANAQCEVLSRGPNLLTSLTYVPEGTLLANAEALVGYADDRYVRVDPATGALTDIGLLNNAASGGTRWLSSGDVVSIKGGGTYLTVKPENGNSGGRGDRIVEVDPKTGGLLRIIGATGMDAVLGLGYWGGVAYGFTLEGKLIQIDLMTGAGTPIPIPGAAADLAFYGAGTTTVAPIIVE